MILDREEFSQMFNDLRPGLGDDSSPLWIPEQGIPCQWFVCVEPLQIHSDQAGYFDWCHDMLEGRVCCYYSDTDNRKEWWGFTCKEDLVLWKLKWA